MRRAAPPVRVGGAVRVLEPGEHLQRRHPDHDGTDGHSRLPGGATRPRPGRRRGRRHPRRGRDHRAVAVCGPDRRSLGPARLPRRRGLLRLHLRLHPPVPQRPADRGGDVRLPQYRARRGDHAAAHPGAGVASGGPHRTDRAEPGRARGARHRRRVHLEHQRAPGLGADERVHGHLRHPGGRRAAGRAPARRNPVLARTARRGPGAPRHPARPETAPAAAAESSPRRDLPFRSSPPRTPVDLDRKGRSRR